MSTTRRTATVSASGNDVERPAPGAAPTAFRIWRRGANPTDHGPTVFSDRSAELLMEQQAERGNRFPIDVDHLSLKDDTPIELRGAVGWFSIDVRNGDLWAVDVKWTPDIAAAIARGEWRYHSPAYDQDKQTNEVVSLINLAITNLPATHGVTSIAANRNGRPAPEKRMSNMNEPDFSPEDVVDALKAIARNANADPNDREKAERTLRAFASNPNAELAKLARAALDSVQAKRSIDRTMGVPQRRGVIRDGIHQHFQAMTRADASAFLAKRAGR